MCRTLPNEFVDYLATRAAEEQSESEGLVTSSFSAWLDEHREKGRFLDVMEFQAPGDRFEL